MCDVTPVQVRVWFHNRRHREKCKSRSGADFSEAPSQQNVKLLDEGPIVQWLSRLVQARQQSSANRCCFGAQLATPLGGRHSIMLPSWCSSVSSSPYSCPSGAPVCPVAFGASAALPLPSPPDSATMHGHPAMWPSTYLGFVASSWNGVSHGCPAPYLPHLPQSSLNLNMSHDAAFPAYPSLMNFPGGSMLNPYMVSYGHGLPSYGQTVLGRSALLGANSQNILVERSNLFAFPMSASSSTSTLSTAGTESLKDFGGTKGRASGESNHREVRPRH